jgi:D-aminopeptidase
LILTPPEAATREAGVTVIDGRLERAIREAVTEALARDARARAALARYWSRAPDRLSGG